MERDDAERLRQRREFQAMREQMRQQMIEEMADKALQKAKSEVSTWFADVHK